MCGWQGWSRSLRSPRRDPGGWRAVEGIAHSWWHCPRARFSRPGVKHTQDDRTRAGDRHRVTGWLQYPSLFLHQPRPGVGGRVGISHLRFTVQEPAGAGYASQSRLRVAKHGTRALPGGRFLPFPGGRRCPLKSPRPPASGRLLQCSPVRLRLQMSFASSDQSSLV